MSSFLGQLSHFPGHILDTVIAKNCTSSKILNRKNSQTLSATFVLLVPLTHKPPQLFGDCQNTGTITFSLPVYFFPPCPNLCLQPLIIISSCEHLQLPLSLPFSLQGMFFLQNFIWSAKGYSPMGLVIL